MENDISYEVKRVSETKAGLSAVLSPVGSDEEIILLFRPSYWKDEDLKIGDVVDSSEFERLNTLASLSKAIARAQGMLANSDYSRARLVQRLLHYDLERDICEQAADYMIEKGYIREKEQTERITRFFCKSNHWGKKRIAAELMGRGYDRKIIMKSLDIISDDEYYQSLMRLIEKKYPEPAEDQHEREKRIAALSRMGYSTAEILRALAEAEELYTEALEIE